jgi:hypothetical protein
MTLARKRPAPPIAQHSDNSRTRANSIAYAALNIFIQDCKDLIVASVTTSIQRQLDDLDNDIQEKGRSRARDLKLWLKTVYPLAWGQESSHATATYALLVNILSDDLRNESACLHHATKHISYIELAQSLIKMATSDCHISAPMRLHGSFLHALQVTLKLMSSIWNDDTNSSPYSCQTFAFMMRKMNIQIIPWHKETASGRARAVSHDWWITIEHNGEHDIFLVFG